VCYVAHAKENIMSDPITDSISTGLGKVSVKTDNENSLQKKDVRMHIMLTPSTQEKLQAACKKYERNPSQQIRYLIQNHC